MQSKMMQSASAGGNNLSAAAKGQQQTNKNSGFSAMSGKNAQDRPVRDLDRNAAMESAEYVAVLACQLQRIAESNGHEFLAYLLDVVVLEAWRLAGPDAEHPDRIANGAGGGRY